AAPLDGTSARHAIVRARRGGPFDASGLHALARLGDLAARPEPWKWRAPAAGGPERLRPERLRRALSTHRPSTSVPLSAVRAARAPSARGRGAPGCIRARAAQWGHPRDRAPRRDVRAALIADAHNDP